MTDNVMNEVLTIARKAGMEIEEIIVSDDNMPKLPLNMSLAEHVDKIREHAIKSANGNMAKAARLLGQESGVLRQWRYYQCKKSLT